MKITKLDYTPISITLETFEEYDNFFIGIKDLIVFIETYSGYEMDKYTYNRILFLKKVLHEMKESK